jgi:O-antigen/teichoic acid export membrane protein
VTASFGAARTLVRGSLWSLLGQTLPVLAALIIVPRLIAGLGVDRFGILSLAWMLIGYFTLFDLGVSGALTRLVSTRIASRDEAGIPALVWTALALTAGMGLVGAAVLAGLAPLLVEHVLRIPPALQGDALGLTRILAASLPIVTSTAALAGVLAAQQRFGTLNALRIPMGILTYVAPLAVLPVTRSLTGIGLALALVRLAGGVAHLAACLATTPGLRAGIALKRALLRPILGFGSWMTVSAVVSPLMVYLDRFVIGSALSMAMVAYYATPYDLASRFGILSMPVVTVVFPAFSSTFDTDRPRTGRLFDLSVRAVAALLFPVVLLCTVFAKELLTLWLGADFAAHSAPVLRLLAAGMMVNGIAQLALALVQSTGRPDLGARVHALELPLYLVALSALVRAQGILGAALAWLLRVVVDAVALFLIARHRLGAEAQGARTALIVAVAALALVIGGCLLPGLPLRAGYAALVLAGYAALAWRRVARPGMRVLLPEPAPAIRS